ncbi:MAG: ATP-binding protein [Desulfovibrionaceae bacterium]
MTSELLTMFSDSTWINEALQAGNTGLWQITLNPDTKQGRLYANNTMLRLLGLEHHPSPEDCYAWWFGRVQVDYIEYVTQNVMQAFAAQQRIEVEYPWDHPLWGKIFVRCGGKPTPSTDGLLHLMGYHQDITELHSTRQSLKESLSSLEMACHIGNIGVFQLLPTKKSFSIVANSLFAAQLDVDLRTPAPQLWESIAQKLTPPVREQWQALPCWEKWRITNRTTLELSYQHPFKGICWINLVCEYFFDGPQILRAVGYVTDITVHKERELHLQKAKEIAEASNLSKSIFLANMSHEIRTPMNGVLNMARLALGTQLMSKQKDYISKIYSSAKIMLHILNDILDFSKIEANKMEIEKRIFTTGPEFTALLIMLQEWSHNKGLSFVTHISPEIPTYLIGDDLRTRQILNNLVSNAIKFTEKGSIKLNITLLSQIDDQVRLAFTVQDTGIGISEAAQKKLFTAFSQVDPSITRRFGGTGLGLAISNTLAQLMGGNITVASTLGGGSTFCLELPFTVPSAKALADNHSPEINIPRDFSGTRILIAEDNDINQEIMVALLEELHAECVVASNGQEVVDIFRVQQHFDCIFMDIQMPIMDGYTATQAIRASGLPNASTIPIIAMTANAMRGDDEKSLNAGMNAHLTKPVEIDDLAQALAHWLMPEYS